MKVLVVEDDESNREVLGELLEHLGHTPFLADTVKKATETVGAVKPDVIVLDLLMNGTLSTPFIDAARDILRDKPPRIVLVSAMRGVENVARSNRVDFLPKPYDCDSIARAVGGDSAVQA